MVQMVAIHQSILRKDVQVTLLQKGRLSSLRSLFGYCELRRCVATSTFTLLLRSRSYLSQIVDQTLPRINIGEDEEIGESG